MKLEESCCCVSLVLMGLLEDGREWQIWGQDSWVQPSDYSYSL
jgi:hypothetical protein